MNGYYITQYNPNEIILLEDVTELFHISLMELVLTKYKFIYLFGKYVPEPKIESLWINLQYSCKAYWINDTKCVSIHSYNFTIPKYIKEIWYFNDLPQIIKELLQSKDTVKIQLAKNMFQCKKIFLK
jgi:hypothetical protein